ncbi:acetolactate synthase [Pasteurellaceae bacterium Pebbles2]|nr:acetolactate synthase [Pasteurellaceae bacterium Pebbles2]
MTSTELTLTELTVVAHHRPEVLERLLRVIRHRGFVVHKMTMQLENEKIWLDLTLASRRDIGLLINQLAKLYDVVDVTCDDCE